VERRSGKRLQRKRGRLYLTDDKNILFPEGSDEWKFKKDIAVLRYLHWCSVSYSMARVRNDYQVAAESLILWCNALYPLTENRSLEDEDRDKYREFIRISCIRLDRFIDMKKTVVVNKQFNNYMMEVERELRMLEHRLGLYMTKGGGYSSAINK
jgi:hypothetical protein